MNGVTAWAGALCLAAVGCTALQLLAPKGGMGRIYHLITAAFFLCCFAAPLLSLQNIDHLESLLPDTASAQPDETLQDNVRAQFERQVAETLSGVCRETLDSYKITADKIDVNMDTDEQGGIYISGIIVTIRGGDSGSWQQAILAKQVLEKRLEIDVEVKTD